MCKQYQTLILLLLLYTADIDVWNQAQQLAESGEQVLLKQILETIKSPYHLINSGIKV